MLTDITLTAANELVESDLEQVVAGKDNDRRGGFNGNGNFNGNGRGGFNGGGGGFGGGGGGFGGGGFNGGFRGPNRF
jgi:hypothetical protein